LVVMPLDGTCDPLGVIRSLKLKELEICAITDARETSLTRRCQALLAGAAVLLETAANDFTDQLRQWIQNKLSAQREQIEQLERTRKLMREMQIVGDSPP